MSDLTPEAVKAALEAYRWTGVRGPLIEMAHDLATAYLELAEENERLRKRLAIWEPQNTAETGRWPIRATEDGK